MKKYIYLFWTIFLRLSLVGLVVFGLFLNFFALPFIVNEGIRYYSQISILKYPTLVALYLTGIPLGITLYQSQRLISHVEKTPFSEATLKSLKYLKLSAIAVAVLSAGSLPFFFAIAELDDAPGVFAIGLALVGAPVVIAAFNEIFTRVIRAGLTKNK